MSVLASALCPDRDRPEQVSQQAARCGENRGDLAGNRKHLAAFLEREVGSDQRPASLARLDDRRGTEPRDDPVPRWLAVHIKSSQLDFPPHSRRRPTQMARRTVLVSDRSGREIEDGKGATVTINFRDARKGTIVLDVTDEEAEELGRNGRKQARRGRRPKSAS